MEGQRKKGYFLLLSGNVIEKFAFNDILFFESQGRKIHLHMVTGELIFYGSLKALRENLDSSFHVCHGSFIVNMTKVIRIEGSEIVLEGGKIIPVSQRKKGETVKKFLATCDKCFPCN